MSSAPPQLIAITALARAGALDRAWQIFMTSGLDQVLDDPATLAVRGRLLKDRALAQTGSARKALAKAAADAYVAAANLRPTPYPLINAATLALLGGDRRASSALAGEALRLIADGVEDETPYYVAATEAEARLLRGEVAAARAALARAIAVAPQAFEDHASTLRQFAVILAELGEDAGWLDALRPPRSLHFAGHLRLDADEAALAARIDAILAREGVGYGYGALAAGADLLIAERVLARGAELHAVLPGGRAAFEARSVEPFGAIWRDRFDAALAAAASVTEVGEAAAASYAHTVELADFTAMGRAAMNARTLQSEALQLVIGNPAAGGQSARAAERWKRSGRRQHVLRLARRPAAPTPSHPFRLAAVLAVGLTASPYADLATFDSALRERLVRLRRLAPLPDQLGSMRWTEFGVTAAFTTPDAAWAAARRLKAALADGPLRQALNLAVFAAADDPAAAEPLLLGRAWAETTRILDATPDSAAYASEPFAAALSLGAAPGVAFVGDLPDAGGGAARPLYSIAIAGDAAASPARLDHQFLEPLRGDEQ